MEQTLLALCGLPASGKTRLAQAIARFFPSQNVRIVSTDTWRDEEYYADFRPAREQWVRRKALDKTDELLESGLSVIHDDTNYYASMRHELLELARRHDTVFGIVHIKTPADTAVIWNSQRETHIPELVIRRIADRMDVPGERYSWDEPILSVDLSITDVTSAAQEIADAIQELEPVEKDDQPAETKTRNDLIDSMTRETVTQFLETHRHLRGDKRVSAMRRDVAGRAMDSEILVTDVQKVLLERLKELL
ncbi:hypothetical protein EU546_04435 [Candidatus Thorarchaeota archaeon]|nr:MAG: hypothetical protein EU546_04435 [Candidatus Thorarchaeota archaeon]